MGAIDRTSHKIERPTAIPQRPFYSGHRHFHCFHTVVIVDNTGNICYIHSGFTGHMYGVLCFNNFTQIGPNTDFEFPDDSLLLADLGYPYRYPVMTPYRPLQIARAAPGDRRNFRKVNRIIHPCRVLVEHLIREIKIMRIVSSTFRHPRLNLSYLVELVAGLTQRRLKLIEQL